MEEKICDRMGRPIGMLRHLPNGDIEAVEFLSRKIIGFYRAASNTTTDFLGRFIAKGDVTAALIFNAEQYL